MEIYKWKLFDAQNQTFCLAHPLHKHEC